MWVLGYVEPKCIDIIHTNSIGLAYFLFYPTALIQREQIDSLSTVYPQCRGIDCLQTNDNKSHQPPCHVHHNYRELKRDHQRLHDIEGNNNQSSSS